MTILEGILTFMLGEKRQCRLCGKMFRWDPPLPSRYNYGGDSMGPTNTDLCRECRNKVYKAHKRIWKVEHDKWKAEQKAELDEGLRVGYSWREVNERIQLEERAKRVRESPLGSISSEELRREYGETEGYKSPEEGW